MIKGLRWHFWVTAIKAGVDQCAFVQMYMQGTQEIHSYQYYKQAKL